MASRLRSHGSRRSTRAGSGCIVHALVAQSTLWLHCPAVLACTRRPLGSWGELGELGEFASFPPAGTGRGGAASSPHLKAQTSWRPAGRRDGRHRVGERGDEAVDREAAAFRHGRRGHLQEARPQLRAGWGRERGERDQLQRRAELGLPPRREQAERYALRPGLRRGPRSPPASLCGRVWIGQGDSHWCSTTRSRRAAWARAVPAWVGRAWGD